MNNSSSWNCFSWNRRDGNLNKDASDKKTPKKQHHKDGSPDEQFANLLGGTFTFLCAFIFIIIIIFLLYSVTNIFTNVINMIMEQDVVFYVSEFNEQSSILIITIKSSQ